MHRLAGWDEQATSWVCLRSLINIALYTNLVSA